MRFESGCTRTKVENKRIFCERWVAWINKHEVAEVRSLCEYRGRPEKARMPEFYEGSVRIAKVLGQCNRSSWQPEDGGGNKDDESYRLLVSLLPMVLEIMERFVRDAVRKRSISKELLSQNQQGLQLAVCLRNIFLVLHYMTTRIERVIQSTHVTEIFGPLIMLITACCCPGLAHLCNTRGHGIGCILPSRLKTPYEGKWGAALHSKYLRWGDSGFSVGTTAVLNVPQWSTRGNQICSLMQTSWVVAGTI